MWILALCGAVFLLVFWYYAIRPMSYWKKKGVKQGNPAWLLGDNWKAIFKIESATQTFNRLYNEHPGERYFGMYQFSLPSLMIRDPELLKQITVKDFEHFVDHNSAFNIEDIEPLLAKNLASLKGQRWREMRPILSPSFTSSKMRSMFVLMSECVEGFTKFYLAKNEEVLEVDVKDAFTRFGNDVIASAAFGIKVDSLTEQDNEFYRMGKAAMNVTGFWKMLKFIVFFMVPKLCVLLKIRLFDKNVTNFFQNLIDETVKVREEKGIVRPDMIHLLMEAKKGNKHEEDGVVETGFATVEEADIGKADVTSKYKEITNMDIAAQALIFFFAGFETVTTLMSFMAYELALNPDVQDTLRQEIEDTKAVCGEKLNYEALMKMKYLDMVVSETLRKWPNAIATDRVCTKPYTIEPKSPTEKSLFIDKRTSVFIPIFAIHHDPNYYRNPEKFDPERFSEENKNEILPYTYLPFGLGPRNCIGSRFALLEVKIMFFHLLSMFELVPTKKTTIPIKLTKSFQFAIEGGFNVGFKRIRNSFI